MAWGGIIGAASRSADQPDETVILGWPNMTVGETTSSVSAALAHLELGAPVQTIDRLGRLLLLHSSALKSTAVWLRHTCRALFARDRSA